MPEDTVTLGHHWIVDLHGCPEELLDDHDQIRHRLRDTSERFGLTLLKIASHRFQPQGVTVVGLLAESHMSIHTWPEYSYAAIDIFTCGSDRQLKAACEHVAFMLQATESNVLRLRRGVQGAKGQSSLISERVVLADS